MRTKTTFGYGFDEPRRESYNGRPYRLPDRPLTILTPGQARTLSVLSIVSTKHEH